MDIAPHFVMRQRKYAKWRSEFIGVSTGGSGFWQIDYDVNSKQCSDLTIDSEDLKDGS